MFVVDVVYDEFSTWKKHFEGFKDETGFPDPSEKLHHIFSEGQKYANDTEAKFHKWKCDPSHKILEGITYGTINATTSDNAAEYWGIEEGREVQLHIFHVQVCNTGDKANKDESGNTKCGKNGRGKGISIGVNQDFDDYAVLVGEIVDMMNKKCHSEDVEKMLQLLQLPESCLADEVQASTTS